MQRRPNSTVLLERARVACLQGALPGFFPEAQPRVLPDETRRKHGGNKHSEAANERVHQFKASASDRIHKFIAGCAELGATLSEVAAALDHPTKGRKFFPNEISGRFKPMVDNGTIFKSGRERDGSEVYVARVMWVNGSMK
jgi:hypothetical protein